MKKQVDKKEITELKNLVEQVEKLFGKKVVFKEAVVSNEGIFVWNKETIVEEIKKLPE